MPARPAIWMFIGPGIVWMALAQGSGELIWWPYIIAKYGLAFLFILIPACLLQFPLTFEIARYTVLTGEGVFRGFFRLNRAYGFLLWLMFTVSFLWFGAFVTAGGTAIAALTDYPADCTRGQQTLFWASLSIFFFTVALLFAKGIYVLIEWVMKVVAVVSLIGMVLACMHPKVLAVIGQFLTGLAVPDFERMKTFDVEADAERLLTAVTFAGLGGFWTLFYSYWMKEKGAGMAAYSRRLSGFRAGETPPNATQPALPDHDPESQTRLKQWYRYVSIETLIGIVGNLATTLMTCLLAFALLHPEGLVPKGFDIAVVQSEFFAPTWGSFGRILFLFIAGTFLADTWLATVDCVSRIHLDALAAMWPGFEKRNQRNWYYAIVLLLALITSVTMQFDSPGPLILISGVIGIFGTVVYSVGLILLNYRLVNRQLPDGMRATRCGLFIFIGVTTFYFLLAALYLVAKIVN
ncbi:MAG: Nramp family divalent metal transporter [Pirellulales bacterium]